jgi:hypothetical protein
VKEELLTILDKLNQAANTDLNRGQPDVVSARTGLHDAMSLLDKLIARAGHGPSAAPSPLDEHPRAKTIRKMKASEDNDLL